MTAPEALIGGRYRVVRRLGAGGMGTVWEAWDELLHRPVAVKQLLSQPGLSPVAAEIASSRAMREARITARLHHPHAVPVYDVVEEDGRPCLIMQYLPSVSLDALVKDKGALPPADVARIGAELASALAAAHDVGIVHRDVKPGNVLITRDGSAKVTDFGIAHAWGDVNLTSTGMLTGTPAYLAPEVARGEESGFPADVFSLGSTLYAALEGAAPFGAPDANPMAVLYKVAAGQVVPPRRSEALTPLLMQMLAPEPADRPSMAEVTRALTLLQPRLASEPDTTQPDSTRPDTTQPVATQPAVDDAPIAATAILPDAQSAARPTAQFAVQPPAQSAAPAPGRSSAAAPPAAADRRPESAGSSASRRPALIIAAAVLILAAATLFGYLAIRDDPDGQQAGAPTSAATGAASTPAGSTGATSAAPTSSQSASTSSSASSSSSASTSASASASASSGAPSATTLTGALTSYYALLPGNTDQGFAQLTSRYKSSTGQTLQKYKGFWSQFQSVKVSNAVAAAPSTVTATITYTYKSGGVAVEKRSFKLISENGVLKIDASTVISG